MRWIPSVAAVLMLALVLPVQGNTTLTANGHSVVISDVSGNEWWVQARLSGTGASTVSRVEAQQTGGTAWTTLPKQSYGDWAASMHVTPGNQVRFRATWPDATQITSCWYTHPAGVEQCAPAPALWPTTLVGDAGRPAAGGGDLAVGDADNDGIRDVTIGDWAGIFTFERDGSSWARQRLGTVLKVDALAVGDGDGDGTREVYAMSNGSLFRERFTGGAWSEQILLTLPQNPNSAGSTISGDMTIGNIDGVAGPELYIAVGHVDCDPAGQSGCSTTSYIHRVAFQSGAWSSTQVSTSGGNIRSMWIGDGDSDGDLELYVGRSSQHAEGKVQIQKVNGAWQTNDLPGSVGTGSQLVVGDVDRDGRSEVYTASFTGDIGLISFDPSTGWTHRVIATLTGAEPDNLFVGDADNDGRQDLYVGQSGDLVQVRYDGGQWKAAVVASQTYGAVSMLVVGDGDGDGRNEAYAGALAIAGNDNLTMSVVRMGEAARTATGTFDATFTAVRGNEWWEQVSVTATGGTLSKVDVRLNGGAWQPLTKQSWGGYAASQHAVQGTTVQFLATSTTGATDASDCYRWIPASNTDAAKVACGTIPPPTTFDATFSNVKGNDWWVEAKVTGNQAIAKVEARINCGTTWQTLALQNWGSYAKSFNAPNGAKVDFRATSSSGETDLSGGYTWPQATTTAGC